MKRRVKWLSVFMVMVLCCQIILLAGPLQVSSEEVDLLTEDVSKRTAQTKTYQLSDGGYTAVMYAEPVHYQNEQGEWEDIDNSLKAVTLKEATSGVTGTTTASVLDMAGAVVGLTKTKSYYRNTNNSFRVFLPREMNKENPVFVESDGYALSFALVEDTSVAAENMTADSEKQELARYQQAMAAATAEEQAQLSMDEVMRMPHQTSELKYAGVRPGVDISYSVAGQSLKEAIIFNEAPRQAATFTYRLEYEGLTPALQENGAVHFYAVDAAEGDGPVFIIQSPYMFDQLDDISTNIAVTLTPADSGCLYTLEPDMAWLQDSTRVYPVTLDPTVYTQQIASAMEDTYVFEDDPTANFGTVNRMYVGSKYTDGTGHEFRTYIRFKSLPTVPSDACIRYAAIDLFHYYKESYQSADNNTYDVYDAGSNNWNVNTITWNTQINYTLGSRITSFVSDMDDADGKDRAVITTLVREWYKKTSNNGLVIKPRTIDNTKTNRTCYASGDSSSTYASSRPKLVVDYYEGDPAPGLVENAVYYIRNVTTGLYVQAGTVASQQLEQNYHDSSYIDTLRWKVAYLGGGCYNFVPQSNTGFRMGVTSSDNVEGNSVEVYTPTHSKGQTFRIYKNEDSLKSYRIQPLCSSTRVVSLATPYKRNDETKLVLRTWTTSLHEARWIFTKTVATKKAKAFGGVFYRPEDDWNYDEVRLAARGFNELLYDAISYRGLNETKYKEDMPKAEVLYLSCHGDANHLYFVRPDKTEFVFVSNSAPEPDEISFRHIGEEGIGMSNVKLMIISACQAANDTIYPADQNRNICQVLQEDLGVDCVIGWKQKLNSEDKELEDDRAWLEDFLQKVNANKTVAQAVSELNMEYDENEFHRDAQMYGTGNFYVKGNI